MPLERRAEYGTQRYKFTEDDNWSNNHAWKTTSTVYDGNGYIISGWEGVDTSFVYVPFNPDNYLEGDYKSSSSEGIRKGFSMVGGGKYDLLGPADKKYQALAVMIGKYSRSYPVCTSSVKSSLENKKRCIIPLDVEYDASLKGDNIFLNPDQAWRQLNNLKQPHMLVLSDGTTDHRPRPPIYFRTNWYYNYGFDKVSELTVENLEKKIYRGRYDGKLGPRLLYLNRNWNNWTIGSNPISYFNLHGYQSAEDGLPKLCYANFDNNEAYLGSVPHLRSLNYFTSSYSDATRYVPDSNDFRSFNSNTYISSINRFSDSYYNNRYHAPAAVQTHGNALSNFSNTFTNTVTERLINKNRDINKQLCLKASLRDDYDGTVNITDKLNGDVVHLLKDDVNVGLNDIFKSPDMVNFQYLDGDTYGNQNVPAYDAQIEYKEPTFTKINDEEIKTYKYEVPKIPCNKEITPINTKQYITEEKETATNKILSINNQKKVTNDESEKEKLDKEYSEWNKRMVDLNADLKKIDEDGYEAKFIAKEIKYLEDINLSINKEIKELNDLLPSITVYMDKRDTQKRIQTLKTEKANHEKVIQSLNARLDELNNKEEEDCFEPDAPNNRVNISSSDEFNKDAPNDMSILKQLIDKHDVSVSISINKTEYPNYLENTKELDPFIDVIRDFINSEIPYLNNNISTDLIEGKDGCLLNFKTLTDIQANNVKSYLITQFNKCCHEILSGDMNKAKETFKGLFIRDNKIVESAWKSGIIFKLLGNIINPKSMLSWIDKDTNFFENEEHVKNAITHLAKTYTVNDALNFKYIFANSQKAKYDNKYMIYGDMEPIKSSLFFENISTECTNSDSLFLSHSIHNVGPEKLKPLDINTVIAKQDNCVFSDLNYNEVSTSVYANINVQLGNKAFITKYLDEYLNGIKVKREGNPCCCNSCSSDDYSSVKGKGCEYSKTTKWTQGNMCHIPLNYFKIDFDKIKNDAIKVIDGYNLLKVDPNKDRVYRLKSMKYNDIEFNSSAVNKDAQGYIINRSSTKKDIPLYLVQQRNLVTETPCTSQVMPDKKVQDDWYDLNIHEKNSFGDKPLSYSSIYLPNDKFRHIGSFNDLAKEYDLEYIPDNDLTLSNPLYKSTIKMRMKLDVIIEALSKDTLDKLKQMNINDITTKVVDGACPLHTTMKCYIITNRFIELCRDILNNNLDAFFTSFGRVIRNNMVDRALYWYYENFDKISDLTYYNLPFGPLMLFNSDSYILNKQYFLSRYRFQKVRDGVSINIPDNLSAWLNKDSNNPLKLNDKGVIESLNSMPEEFINELLTGNYLDVFMSDLISASISNSNNDNIFVIHIPTTSELLKITHVNYSLLNHQPIIEMFDDVNKMPASYVNEPVMLVSPYELNETTAKTIYNTDLCTGTHFTISIPVVSNFIGSIASTLRIGLTTWHVYINNLLSVDLHPNEFMDLRHKQIDMKLSRSYEFMTACK